MSIIFLKDYVTNGTIDGVTASEDISKMLNVGYLMADSILQYAVFNRLAFIDEITAKQYLISRPVRLELSGDDAKAAAIEAAEYNYECGVGEYWACMN